MTREADEAMYQAKQADHAGFDQLAALLGAVQKGQQLLGERVFCRTEPNIDLIQAEQRIWYKYSRDALDGSSRLLQAHAF